MIFGQVRNRVLSLLLLLPLLLIACEEEGPDIRLNPPDDPESPADTTFSDSLNKLTDTTFVATNDTTAQPKRLLVEDFTAVRCNNCPKAANVIKALKASYGDTVIALGIHCNRNFSRPYEESRENYSLEKGQNIYEWFGRPRQPSGMLDRHAFPNKDEVVLSYQSWESLAPQRLDQKPGVNVYLQKNLSREAQKVRVTVRSRFLEPVSGTVFLSLMITEDNIEDVQLGPDQKRPDYEHNHVVRHIQTPARGLALTDNPAKGRVVIRTFTMPIKDKWKLPDLNIVAFAHRKNPKGPVLQTQKISVD